MSEAPSASRESWLDRVLTALPGVRVGVIGDFCLDVYWFIDAQASETSIETGKPTHPVREQRYSLGGAGNVVANLRALGVGDVRAFGVVGDDPFGARQRKLLTLCGASPDGLVTATDERWQTLAYTKPYVGEEELSRLDMGNFNRLPDAVADELLARLEACLSQLQIVIVNQQVANGLHTPCFRQALDRLMRRHPDVPFIFDGRHFLDAYPLARLKVNAHEACRLCGVRKETTDVVLREEALTAARALFARLGRPVFVTRGERGSVVVDAGGVTEVPGLLIIGRTDPVGAGDSFLAGLAAALAAGVTPEQAAQLGNFVAGVTVTKLRQTGTASPEEVRRIGHAPDYVFEPEIADNPRWARRRAGSDIEIVREPPPDLAVGHAIFDHDGTISVLRQGWEEVMEPMMMHAILGERYHAADEALFHRVRDRVRRFIDQTTGIQTLQQMQGLVDMVREFGLIADAQILDAAGYKVVYNDALMELVRDRLARLQRGELVVEDFVIKQAVTFLQRLHAAGIELVLASGTDQADVAAEAAALGYADLFQGRIYGSVGDVTKDAKRLVLDRIWADLGGQMGGVVIFGDGPVEMREGQRRGAYTVGVASDEIRRYGLNLVKRTRLIRAGAAVVIPDFSQLPSLLEFFRLRA